MALEQEQILRQEKARRKLDAETKAFIRRQIITPAMREINERLSQLYDEIVETADLSEYRKDELNRLLNLQGATYPISEQLKKILA